MTISIHLDGSRLWIEDPRPVLADGTANKVRFRLSPDSEWDGLTITVIFRRVYAIGVDTRKVVISNVGAAYAVPHEVLHDGWLYIGAVGVAQNGEVRLTTAKMESPLKVSASEDGDADPAGSITPEVADQILALIGAVSNLDTTNKSSLVAAINEVAGKADNAATAAATARKTADQAATAAGNATTAAQNAQRTADQATTAAGNAATAAATAQRTADQAATAAGNAATAAATAKQTADNAATAAATAKQTADNAATDAGKAATAAATAQQTADNAATAAGKAATAAATAQQTADNAATDAIKAAGAAAYAVKYRAQDLSASQKEQARKNIGAPEMGVTDVTPEWLAWCDDNGIADADCTESDVFSFLRTLSSGIYCLTTGFFGQVWALIYGAYAKHLVAFIEGRVYVEEDTVISDSGIIAYGGEKAKITDIADSVYEDVTSSYEAANTSGTLTPAGYVKRLAKDGKYRIRIGSIGDALFEKMTVDGSKWLFGRSTDGVSVSYTIDRDDTTLLSMSTAGTAKIGDKTVLTDAFIAKPTSDDAGKVLTVGAGGNPEWTAVVNAEEVAV